MEGGKISHKRVIAVTIAAILGWGIIYSVVHARAANERQAIINSTMIFVLVMSGVATVAQVVSLIRGGKPEDKDETPKT